MSRIALIRTDQAMPDARSLDAIRGFLFGVVDGFSRDDKSAWRKYWSRVMKLEPGEMTQAEMVFPRSSPYHRRHMKIEQAVYDAQDRFTDFEMFRDWLKIGAAWAVWVPGAKGGIVPLPKSVSYAKADQAEFEQFHRQIIDFLRSGHAAPYLWRHLGEGAHGMMNEILEGFGE